MFRLTRIYFIIISLIVGWAPLYSLDYSIGVGSELTQGQTSYDIGISLLEFPVASTLSNTIQSHLMISDRLSVSLHASQGSSQQQSEKFVDSDFLIANDSSSLYLISESDNDVSHHSFSFDLNYIISSTDRRSYSVGFGYKQQAFDYSVYNVKQWLVQSPQSAQYINGTTALTYTSTESIPYLSFGITQKWSKLTISAHTELSTLVSFKGYDNHILRSKEINFTGKGSYVSLRLLSTYSISSRLLVSLGCGIHHTKTVGEHTQNRYSTTSEGGAGIIGYGTQTTLTTLSSVTASLSYQF